MKKWSVILISLSLTCLARVSAQTSSCLSSNIAAGQPVTATDYTDGATNVVDGDVTTTWYPTTDGDQWIYVDLGQNYTLCKVVLLWNAWHGQDTFKVQFSADTTHWTDVAYNTAEPVAGPTGTSYQMTTVDLSASTMAGRYVRIYLYNIVGWNIQMEELQVYNKLPVSLPVVSLTAPADGANYTEGDSVVLQATASETGGAISQVQFYQGTTLLGSSSVSPYTYTWKQVPEGEYVMTAKAIDTNGYSMASTSINVYVDYPPPSWSLIGNAGTNADSNFLGTTDSTKLVFRTNNLKRMTILPNGNIGIGVDTPTAQLHTSGTVRFAGLTNDSTKTRLLVTDSSGNVSYRTLTGLLSGSVLVQGGNTFGSTTILGTKDNNNLDFYTNNTDRARLTNTGNLLVGTTSDNGNKLQVNGSLSATASSYINGFNFISTAYASIIKSDSAKSILIGSPGTVAGTSGFTNHVGGSIVIHLPLNSGAGLTDSVSNSVLIGRNSSLATATIDNSLVVAKDMGYDSDYNGSLLKSNLTTFGGTRGFLRDDNPGGAAYMFGEFTGNLYFGYNVPNWYFPVASIPSNYIQIGTSSHNLLALFGGFHATPPQQSTLAGPSYRPGDANSSFSTGQYFRIGAGRGTGAGAGSDLRLAVAPPTVYGSDLNPYVDAVTISGSTAYVGIGTTTPQSQLAVNGTITAKKVVVTQTGWPDYVFNKTYRLLSLGELEKYIREHRHLPGVTSAPEVARKGLDLGANQTALLKKIEELTLYLIHQNREADEQDAQLRKQQEEIDALRILIIRKNQ
ncbi:MAG: discoidin domain-containing protein [Puia sp.]|nr:discoidin domain-containing protein [Puia sp.]